MRKLMVMSSGLLLLFFTSCNKDKIATEPGKSDLSEIKSVKAIDGNPRSVLSLVFNGSSDETSKIVQTSKSGMSRSLVNFPKNGNEKFFKYLLSEVNEAGVIVNSDYVISKNYITRSVDLFSFIMEKDKIIYYDESTTKSKNGKKMNLEFKYAGKTVDPKSAFSKTATLPCGQNVCFDWYL
ncbi:MAG: hypothetical protein H0W12_02490, partial [Chitinophagaceae bacterium]|nr:hypothetical protein [Chitinophagaceae bacterium]